MNGDDENKAAVDDRGLTPMPEPNGEEQIGVRYLDRRMKPAYVRPDKTRPKHYTVK